MNTATKKTTHSGIPLSSVMARQLRQLQTAVMVTRQELAETQAQVATLRAERTATQPNENLSEGFDLLPHRVVRVVARVREVRPATLAFVDAREEN